MFLLVVTYSILNVISSLLYVGLLLFLFGAMKKTFKMNEEKWSSFFRYRKGKRLSFIMVSPYLLVIVIMYPLTMLGFDLIHLEYRISGYIAAIMLPMLMIIFNLPKLKRNIVNKHREGY